MITSVIQILPPQARSSLLHPDPSSSYLSPPARSFLVRQSALIRGDVYIHQAKTPQGNDSHIAKTLQTCILQDIRSYLQRRLQKRRDRIFNVFKKRNGVFSDFLSDILRNVFKIEDF